MVHQDKKRDFSHQFQDHQPLSKKTSHSFPSRIGAQLWSPEILSRIETTFLRPLVREEVGRKVEAHFNLPKLEEEVVAARSGIVKLNLCFLNRIPSVFFNNNEIEAEKGETLQIALCDTTNCNAIVRTNPLSSALIEFVVLNGEFGSGHRNNNVGDFDKSIVLPRPGERPLLAGNDKTIRLKNGVASIKNLTFTGNSSRSRTKEIRLGVRIKDEGTDADYPKIGEGVSNPFRVKDNRGKANTKPHPPRGDDEVFRLECIRKDGEYHKRLSSNGIETVDDFVKAHNMDHRSLRKLLGNKVPEKKWTAMVNHALEYVRIIPTFDPNLRLSPNFVENEAMQGEAFNKILEVCEQNTIPSNAHGFSGTFSEKLRDYILIEEPSTSSSLFHEVENTNTCNRYFQGAWTKS